jgi:uncharacterized protein (DUF58 family)
LNGPWDPRVLERVRHLHLHARQAVAGIWHGTQRSVHTGHDVEFADYKPYDAGDSLRDVDWRVLARTDRLVVRRYRAETELPVTILLDASADLGSTPAKLDAALRLAATLAYLLFLDGEPVGLTIGAGDGVALRRLPPRRGTRHRAPLCLLWASVRPAGRAGLDGLFRDVGAQLGARSLVAVVSDFMEEPAGWGGSLAALTRKRVDLRAFHVWDPAELELRYGAPLRLRSPETGGEIPIDPTAARTAFAGVVQEYFDEVRSAVHARRGRWYAVPADADQARVLARFLEGGA